MKSTRLPAQGWLCALLGLALSPVAFSADKPLNVSASFDLAKSAGKETFFQLMSKTGGIKKSLDTDWTAPFVVVSAKTFRAKASNFSHLAQLERKIVGGAAGLVVSVGALVLGLRWRRRARR